MEAKFYENQEEKSIFLPSTLTLNPLSTSGEHREWKNEKPQGPKLWTKADSVGTCLHSSFWLCPAAGEWDAVLHQRADNFQLLREENAIGTTENCSTSEDTLGEKK